MIQLPNRALSIALLALSTPTLLAIRSSPQDKSRLDAEVSKSEVRQSQAGWQLFVDGEPFLIQGAGLEFGSMSALAAHGANSLRTWRTDNGRR